MYNQAGFCRIFTEDFSLLCLEPAGVFVDRAASVAHCRCLAGIGCVGAVCVLCAAAQTWLRNLQTQLRSRILHMLCL